MKILSDFRAKNIVKYYWLCDEIFANWIVQILKPYGKSILDIGCGNGFMLPYYLNNFDQVAGIEPSDSLYRQIYQKYSSTNVMLKKAAAEQIPFCDKSFDISVAKSSLHHFNDMEIGIVEMRRVSKKAIALIEVVSPDESCISFLKNILLKKEKGRELKSIFTKDLLCDLVKTQMPDAQVHTVFFDQYIDVQEWLLYSDLMKKEQDELYNKILFSEDNIKNILQIHFRNDKLVMLRRMCLCIALF